MSLEDDLRTIWQKYEPQREAERNAAETARTAARELAELNAKRLRAGLPSVCEYSDRGMQGIGQMQAVWAPVPRTWRDDLRDDVMAAVRKAFE